jgi:hypothetical protein
LRMFPFFVHAKQNEFLQRNRIKVGLERYVENFRERGSGVAAKLAVQIYSYSVPSNKGRQQIQKYLSKSMFICLWSINNMIK